jgi:hypothetical protein
MKDEENRGTREDQGNKGLMTGKVYSIERLTNRLSKLKFKSNNYKTIEKVSYDYFTY